MLGVNRRGLKIPFEQTQPHLNRLKRSRSITKKTTTFAIKQLIAKNPQGLGQYP